MRSRWVQVGLVCVAMQVTPGHVSRVLDGDTFALYHVGTPPEERVRILGVNTPERGQPGAAEATAFTKDWLARGPFDLTACKRDSFGRLLGSVTRNGESVAGELIDRGLGKPYEGGVK